MTQHPDPQLAQRRAERALAATEDGLARAQKTHHLGFADRLVDVLGKRGGEPGLGLEHARQVARQAPRQAHGRRQGVRGGAGEGGHGVAPVRTRIVGRMPVGCRAASPVRNHAILSVRAAGLHDERGAVPHSYRVRP